LQTVVGCYLPWRRLPYRASQHRVLLADGDTIVLHDDCPPAWQHGDPAALLVHGLGGCHQSGYMERGAGKLNRLGYRVFRMDLRGYGAGLTLARHPIHAGRSEDAAASLAFVNQLCPDSPVHVVGFSMGANIVLKMAGEFGSLAPDKLASVMAVAPPIDLIECSRNVQLPKNRLYDRSFVYGLLRHVRRKLKAVPDALSRELRPRPRRLLDFDNHFTAPLSGFADAHDYYTRASSGPLLPHIAVPTLIVTAANDPIIPVGPFERASYSPTTRLVVTPCGGHLGFISRGGSDPDRRWLDWRVIEWIASHSKSPSPPAPHLRRTAATAPAV
jgi:predicted alpha/beta-fold hydrolase